MACRFINGSGMVGRTIRATTAFSLMDLLAATWRQHRCDLFRMVWAHIRKRGGHWAVRFLILCAVLMSCSGGGSEGDEAPVIQSDVESIRIEPSTITLSTDGTTPATVRFVAYATTEEGEEVETDMVSWSVSNLSAGEINLEESSAVQPSMVGSPPLPPPMWASKGTLRSPWSMNRTWWREKSRQPWSMPLMPPPSLKGSIHLSPIQPMG